MQLLVSVRSGDEVKAALAGGADIIDAKEPANGPLGAVSAATLMQVAARIPGNQQFSVALGDVKSSEEVLAAVRCLKLPSRTAPTYLKLGFAAVQSHDLLLELLTIAIRSTAVWPSTSIVAVAYADAERASSPPAHLVLSAAARAGAAGVLVDTYVKDGAGLMDWWSSEALAAWIALARKSGLLTAAAGALSERDVDRVAAASPDVIGFRGAACDAGRLGRVSAERVALLRRCVDAGSTGALPHPAYSSAGGGAKRVV